MERKEYNSRPLYCITPWAWLCVQHVIFNQDRRLSVRRSLYSSGGGDRPKRLKTCTNEEPTTTIRKKMINLLEIGVSSSRSAAFPAGTCPRFVIFLSNLLFRFRMFRGRGYNAGIFVSYAMKEEIYRKDTRAAIRSSHEPHVSSSKVKHQKPAVQWQSINTEDPLRKALRL